MQKRLPASVEKAGRDVSVAVTDEQRCLKKNEAGIPDAWRAAEKRQHDLCEHRFDAEQKRGVDENADGE